MLVAWRQQGRAVFLYGFAKSEQDNISFDELASLREIAAAWLGANTDRITAAIEANELQEVGRGEAENLIVWPRPFSRRPMACTGSVLWIARRIPRSQCGISPNQRRQRNQLAARKYGRCGNARI